MDIQQLPRTLSNQVKTIQKLSLLLILFAFSPGIAFADNLDCPCTVVKVSDGNTVHVLVQSKLRHKIRLAGIDVPERKQAFGKKSGKNLANLVAGKNVEVEYSKRDRYGRIIGNLFKDGQDIKLLQVKQGFARYYKYYQKEQSEIDRISCIVLLKSRPGSVR